MNLQTLMDTVFDEDLDARVNSVSLDEAGDLRLQIGFDSLVVPEGKQHVELKCLQPKEFNVTAGPVGCIAQFEEHVLLANHCGPQSQLFFSSAPPSPEEVFYLAHSVLTSEMGGWRDPATYLNGTPEELRRHLLGGYGLLARGPHSAMAAIAAAVGSLLTIRSIESRALHSTAMALTLGGRQFVICESVEVLHNGNGPLKGPLDGA